MIFCLTEVELLINPRPIGHPLPTKGASTPTSHPLDNPSKFLYNVSDILHESETHEKDITFIMRRIDHGDICRLCNNDDNNVRITRIEESYESNCNYHNERRWSHRH